MSALRRTALLGLGTGLAVTLPRMRGDVEKRSVLRGSTAFAMWACYITGAALYADAARSGRPLTSGTRATAFGVAAAGAAMAAAGMGMFRSIGQVNGTADGPLATTGIYRFSRNPQYTGLVLAGAAGAAATRSPGSAALTALYAAVCRWWVPIEERSLAARHGSAYATYCSQTARWLGRPRAQD